MRIGRKLAVTYGLMSILLVGIVFGAKVIIDRIDQNFEILHHEFSSVNGELDNLRAASLQILAATNEFAFIASITSDITDDGLAEAGEIEELEEGIATLTHAFARFSDAVDASDEAKHLNRD
ncbi:MAG: hypothetical protein HKN28_11185 [Alphaproteobacteria bacterium]|nr:hypothetical protein [Alphaproteobacteria bacterium]